MDNQNKIFKFRVLNPNNSENEIFYAQDEKLLDLKKSVKNVLHISQQVHDELVIQNKIIDNLEDSVVETTDKINKTEKKTALLIKENEKCCIIL